MYNDEVLYSLTGVNLRIDRILHDTIFTSDLCLFEYCSIQDTTFPLPDSIIDRFCSKILPQIGHQIKSLSLSRASIERVLHATNYPNLNYLGLFDISFKTTFSLFSGENSLNNMFKNQISSLFINLIDENKSMPTGPLSSEIFLAILKTCNNLRCLKINPSSSYFEGLRVCMYNEIISSTLVELHITVHEIEDCFRILDGRFDQLRVLYVTCQNDFSPCVQSQYEQKPLTNLRIFSFSCEKQIYTYRISIMSLLRRMLNLEELDLNIKVKCNEKFIDGDILRKNIIIHMPRLYKFTFNIYSIIDHRNQTNFPLNEHIQETFKYFSNTQIITSIVHFSESQISQCHIYSYPYKFKIYNNITNNFSGGLFTSVTRVSLYDEYPFEYEFFLRIQKSFPFMKELTINNLKARNSKQFIKSNNDNQISPIIEYSNLTHLDVSGAHDDYLELFLFDTNVSLPNNLHLRVTYESLQRVTYNFTRYKTSNNYAKLAALYFYSVKHIREHTENYFPYTRIHDTGDYYFLRDKSSHSCYNRYTYATSS